MRLLQFKSCISKLNGNGVSEWVTLVEAFGPNWLLGCDVNVRRWRSWKDWRPGSRKTRAGSINLLAEWGGGGCSTPRHERLRGMGLTWRSGDTWKVYLQALKCLADFESYLLGIYLWLTWSLTYLDESMTDCFCFLVRLGEGWRY